MFSSITSVGRSQKQNQQENQRLSHNQPIPSHNPPFSTYPSLPPAVSQPPQSQIQYWNQASQGAHQQPVVLSGPSYPSSQNVQPPQSRGFQPPSTQMQPFGSSMTQQQSQMQSQNQNQGQGQNQWGSRSSYSYATSNTVLPAPPTSSMMAQPLETVQRDEDPVYGPLGRAGAKIQRGLTADTEITSDMADQLANGISTSEPYVPLPSASHAFRPFRITKTSELPDALHRELNLKDSSAKMGLFEEIERAWFTVDNKLFLWDYTDGRDFSRYDEQPDTIQAVGLVKARKDVFVDDITHVLIICTSSRVSLLGLSRPSSHELNLYATNLSADTPIAMLQISGTASGRVFMRGSNKELYELEYTSDSRWFFGSGAKVTLTNHSSGTLSNWMPSVFSAANTEGIEHFVIDSPQNRLYTLHTRGHIEQFDVLGTSFISKAKYTQIQNKLARDGFRGPGTTNAGLRIVTIGIVGGNESRSTCLVAITANGIRIYLSTLSWKEPVIRRPIEDGLRLSEQSIYSSGTFIGVQHDESGPTPSTRLHIMIPNYGREASRRENFEVADPAALQESSIQESIPSQVWTVVEVSATCPANNPASLRRSDGIALNPLATQAITESRSFLILATSGLFFAIQPRPIDMLQADLEVEKDTAINTIRNTFGKHQLAAMGITLGAQADLKQPDVASAVNTILLSAGAPMIRDGTTGRSIVYSSRHEGFALLLARFLRPIWDNKVTINAPMVGAPGRQALGATEGQLLAVQGRLQQLREYLEEHPFPRVQTEGDHKIAWDQEELSLHGLQVLLKHSIEAISFLLLLNDYKMPEVIARCDSSLQQTLASLTFRDLFTTTGGRDVARKLVTALIEQQIGQELGIDTLSEILQQRCGSFCQPGDVVLYKAEESMRRAESSRDPVERAESLAESLRLFTRAASSMPLQRVQDASKRFRTQQYVPGSVELGLRCASELDSNDKALDYVRDGRHPYDPRKGLYDTRTQCYECVIDALAMYDERLDKATADGNAGPAMAKRDEAYSLAINSDDELFHYYLYDWHVARGLQEQVLEFDTPFIEGYLKMTCNDEEERRDLLWKFYGRREEFLLAARALFDLATRQSHMALSDRIYYLAQSLTSAKSAASLGVDDVEFTSMMQERMDVAQVQMEVARGIEAQVEMTREEKDEQLTKLNGDLLDMDQLYQSFARPFRLYEAILLILKTADTRVDDVCEAVWTEVLRSAQGSPVHVAKAELITNLLRLYYPSEAAPLDIVLPLVYAQGVAMSGAEEGWTTRAVLEGGVPMRECWEAVMMLHDQAQTEEDREYCTEELGVLAERWVDDREAIPLADVERFVSEYLLRTTTGETSERRARTRERMGKAKTTAIRW